MTDQRARSAEEVEQLIERLKRLQDRLFDLREAWMPNCVEDATHELSRLAKILRAQK